MNSFRATVRLTPSRERTKDESDNRAAAPAYSRSPSDSPHVSHGGHSQSPGIARISKNPTEKHTKADNVRCISWAAVRGPMSWFCRTVGQHTRRYSQVLHLAAWPCSSAWPGSSASSVAGRLAAWPCSWRHDRAAPSERHSRGQTCLNTGRRAGINAAGTALHHYTMSTASTR